jgi:hypothetical protein
MARQLPIVLLLTLTLLSAGCGAGDLLEGAPGAAPPPPESPPGAAATQPSAAPPPGPRESLGPPVTSGAVLQPQAGLWQKAGVEESVYRDDLDSCVALAHAEVTHDQRIERDREAARDRTAEGLAISEFSDRVQAYDEKRRWAGRFDSCMIAKGYNRLK